jgi:hypothetical protein
MHNISTKRKKYFDLFLMGKLEKKSFTFCNKRVFTPLKILALNCIKRCNLEELTRIVISRYELSSTTSQDRRIQSIVLDILILLES